MEYEVRPDYYYTRGDTWARKTPEGHVRVGISDYAQKKLKRIEYLNLPEENEAFTQGESLGEVESQKSVSDLMAPISGKVVGINDEAVSDPALLNSDPYGAGWILEMDCPDFESQTAGLMNEDAYRAHIQAKEKK